MNFQVFAVVFVAVLLWELVEARTDFLLQKRTRIAARKSSGFWLVVVLIAAGLGAFWAYFLSNGEGEVFFYGDRPTNAVILAGFFCGFGSIPALKSFKLLPVVNKAIGKIGFDDTALTQAKGPLGALRLWWSL